MRLARLLFKSSRRNRISRASLRKALPRNRPLLLEPLEPRLLLSAAPFYSAAAASAAVDLTLRLDTTGTVETLKLLDSAGHQVASQALNEVTGAIKIVGSD